MPYRKEPRWAVVAEEIIQVSRYISLAISGTVAVLYSATNGLDLAGFFIAMFSLVALGGVITRRYHFELIALYFLCSALCVASAILFASNFATVAWLVFALVAFVAERLLYLSVIALDARKRVRGKNV